MEKEEIIHLTNLLKSVQNALIKKDAVQLKNLSNQTLHSSSIHQHRGLIAIAVISYALSKIIERGDFKEIANWNVFVKKFNAALSLAISALKKSDFDEYGKQIQHARRHLEEVSTNLKSYMKEIIQKARINKASRIYEHGISLEQTAKLLGITQWDLSEYTGRSKTPEVKQNLTINTKTRAKTALEFFK